MKIVIDQNYANYTGETTEEFKNVKSVIFLMKEGKVKITDKSGVSTLPIDNCKKIIISK